MRVRVATRLLVLMAESGPQIADMSAEEVRAIIDFEAGLEVSRIQWVPSDFVRIAKERQRS